MQILLGYVIVVEKTCADCE